MKKIGLILLAYTFFVNCASTEQSPVSSPNVLDFAPDFSLVDVSGNEVRLSYFKGKKNIALIFYADNNWQISLKQLGGLQERISEIEKLNAEVIAISTVGDQQDVETTKGSLGISFILIPKPNRQAVEDFGLKYNVYVEAYATFIIDKKGRIRFKSVNTPDSLIWPSKIIRELQGI